MKKIGTVSLIIIISLGIFFLGFSYKRPTQPYTHYDVYLDGNLLGTIQSKSKLEKYIQEQGNNIKKNVEDYSSKLEIITNSDEVINSISDDNYLNLSLKDKSNYLLTNSKTLNISDIKIEYLKKYVRDKLYDITEDEIKEMEDYVSKNQIYITSKSIYVPNGLKIKKINTYDSKFDSIQKIYKTIVSKESPTIAGYKFTIKKENEKAYTIYVTDKKVFEEAIDNVAKIFVGEEQYELYKNKQQKEIVDTGTIIEKVYVEEDISYKATNISVNERIYTDAKELSSYLLYGDSYEQSLVSVKEGDSISSIAYQNQISIEEFLISNPEFTTKENLLYEGKQVIISKLNPQIRIIEELHSVNNVETNYSIVEQYDSSINRGSELVTQEGEKGIERVTQNVKSINGQIVYVEPVNKETIKQSVSKVVTVGTKYVASVGSTATWGWPTNSGYTITSYYQYRFSPINGHRELHTGIDIAGTGYGSPVYATNNGTIEERQYTGSYGNAVLINHGNGFWTLYAHLSRFSSSISVGSVVSRGDIIGYVGSTGAATGPHLHYEIRKGCGKFNCVTNPLPFYQ